MNVDYEDGVYVDAYSRRYCSIIGVVLILNNKKVEAFTRFFPLDKENKDSHRVERLAIATAKRMYGKKYKIFSDAQSAAIKEYVNWIPRGKNMKVHDLIQRDAKQLWSRKRQKDHYAYLLRNKILNIDNEVIDKSKPKEFVNDYLAEWTR
jgi:hypothetical protein